MSDFASTRAVLVAGSPSDASRSAALLDAAGRALAARGITVRTLALRELPAEALLQARTDAPELRTAFAALAGADVVVLATPIYKAAYSGLLKAFLDLLPQDGLAGKWAWSLATGGSPAHLLALDHSMTPVLDSLGARRRLPSVYATDAQIPRGDAGFVLSLEIVARLNAVASDLAYALEGERQLARMRAAAAVRQDEPARCSA